MTREEILAKSRKENSTGDEREHQIWIQSGHAGYMGCLFLCFLGWLLNFAFDGPEIVGRMLLFIHTGTLTIEKCYQAARNRTKTNIIIAALWLLVAIGNLFLVVHGYLHGT